MKRKDISNQIRGVNETELRDKDGSDETDCAGPYWEGELVLNERHDGKTVEVEGRSGVVVTLKEGEGGYWILTKVSGVELEANAYATTEGSFGGRRTERVIELSVKGGGEMCMEYVSEETHTKIDGFSVEFVSERAEDIRIG